MDQLLEQVLQYLRGIWLRRFWGLGVAWLIAAVGLPIAIFAPARYEASARVFVNTETVLKPLMVGLAVQPNTEQQVKMLADTLLSRPNVEKLILLADLDHTTSSERDRDALVSEVTQGVRVTGSTKDNLFSLSYRDTDPARAKRIVDSLLSMFVESGLSNKRFDTEKALTFLDAQVREYEGVLANAEERLKDFRLQNLDQITAQDTVGSMLALDGEIEKARTDLRAAEQRRDALRRQLTSEEQAYPSYSTDQTSGAPKGGDSLAEIDARADALRRNLDELLRKYTEVHPDVVGTRRVLADLEKQRAAMLEASRQARPNAPLVDPLRGKPDVVYQQLKLTLADAEANVAALSARLVDLENRYNRKREAAKLKPEFEEELAQLNRDYQIQKTKFEQLVQRREAAKLTGELDATGSVDFRIIDPPRVSPNPVAPKRLQLIGAALLLSLGAGVASSFLMSQMFPTVSSAKELRSIAQVSVLGSVSSRPTPAFLRRQRRRTYLLAGGLTGLCAMFGVALTVLFVATRMG